MSTKCERRFTSREAAPVELEKRDDGSRAIVGYGAVYYRDGDDGTEYWLWDDMVERIMPGAFDRALDDGDDARGLFNHDPSNLLGRVSSGTMQLSVDDTGLRYEIPVDENDSDHMRVVAKIERGDLTGSSFAFMVDEMIWEENNDTLIRWIKSVTLRDTGPVTYPAYEGTTSGLRAEELRAEYRAQRDDAEEGQAEGNQDESQIPTLRRKLAVSCM